MRRPWIVLASIVGIAAILSAVALAVEWQPIPRSGDGTASAGAADPDAANGPPRVAWAFASMLPPDEANSFVLQAGFLGDEAPRIDLDIPWAVDPNVDLGRTPAVSRPAAGSVAFVADDGVTSRLSLVPIAVGGEPRVLAELDVAVWTVALAPDASAAYLAVSGRGGEMDGSIIRVALDGSGETEVLLPPAGEAARPRDAVLVAVATFHAVLDVSPDGRLLGAMVCRGAAGCTSTVIDLESGDRLELDDSTLYRVGAGGLAIIDRCTPVACLGEVLDVDSGATAPLPGHASEASLASVGGRPVVVWVDFEDPRGVLMMRDVAGGDRVELFRAGDRATIFLSSFSGLLWSVPNDAVLLLVNDERPGPAGATEVTERHLLVPLDGGAPIELPGPSYRPVGQPGAKG